MLLTKLSPVTVDTSTLLPQYVQLHRWLNMTATSFGSIPFLTGVKTGFGEAGGRRLVSPPVRGRCSETSRSQSPPPTHPPNCLDAPRTDYPTAAACSLRVSCNVLSQGVPTTLVPEPKRWRRVPSASGSRVGGGGWHTLYKSCVTVLTNLSAQLNLVAALHAGSQAGIHGIPSPVPAVQLHTCKQYFPSLWTDVVVWQSGFWSFVELAQNITSPIENWTCLEFASSQSVGRNYGT